MYGADLETFQFQGMLTFAAFFLNADGTITCFFRIAAPPSGYRRGFDVAAADQ